jgi:endothelin-converting enzyme/putative endopeptidase
MRSRSAFVLFCLLFVTYVVHAQPQTFPDLKFDINAVDRSADPCNDFYQYACGGWMARNPIPPDRSSWAVFRQMQDLNQKRVVVILERAAEARADRSSIEQKIGDYFESCRDEKTINAKGIDPLRPELARIDAIKNSDDLADAIAHLQGLGPDAFFQAYPDQKLNDATRVIAYLDQSGLNLPEPGYYLDDTSEMRAARQHYREHLEKIFAELGDDSKQSAQAAEDVLHIETTLAGSSLRPLERRDRKAWYHEMSFAQLQALAPAFPWKRYFAALGVDASGEVNVAVPRYMQAVNEMVAQSSMQSWKHYLQWELVRSATPALAARFRDLEFGFYGKTLRDVQEQSSRAQQCEALTSRDLREAVGKVYAERYFPPETKQRALDMGLRIRKAMEQDFKEAPWMTEATKAEALKKLSLLRVMLGYPDHWRDYSSLEIRRGDALGNAFRSQQFEFRRQLAKIGKPVDRGEFYEPVQGVEGYHDNPLNVVVFTAGILQPPFFDPRMDDAINFGLAGAVIGHELSHAFDDKGHLFDGDGNMRNWWTPQDAKNFDERAACFVRQYSSYTVVDDVKVNGELTLGENTADNGGLQLAWKAFESDPSRGEPVDGFNPDQRLFLGWAQWRCMNVTDKTAKELARTDPHSPGRWRVNGVVSNMPAFAHAYHCKTGDAMVNKKPCRVW